MAGFHVYLFKVPEGEHSAVGPVRGKVASSSLAKSTAPGDFLWAQVWALHSRKGSEVLASFL